MIGPKNSAGTVGSLLLFGAFLVAVYCSFALIAYYLPGTVYYRGGWWRNYRLSFRVLREWLCLGQVLSLVGITKILTRWLAHNWPRYLLIAAAFSCMTSVLIAFVYPEHRFWIEIENPVF